MALTRIATQIVARAFAQKLSHAVRIYIAMETNVLSVLRLVEAGKANVQRVAKGRLLFLLETLASSLSLWFL